MERLNGAYAGDAHATDVLSFAGSDSHLGDIAISWAAVERQAAERKEMTRLTVAALERSGIRLAPRRL